VIGQLRIFSLLLGPKARGFLRLARTREHRHPLRLLFFIGLGLVFAAGIYLGSAWFLRQCLQVELVGVLIPRKMMSLVLLILVSILLISTTISSFSIFYLSDDLVLLFSAPVPLGPLYYARFLEMTLHASWMVVFFGLPVFLAYGAVYEAPAVFYLQVALLFPAFILIPSALGAIIAAVLTRLFSARRSRDLLIVLVLALWLPLVTLAKSTSFLVLFIFSLINLSLLRIKWREPHPQGVRPVPQWVPAGGIVASLGLLLFQVFAG